ncbi:MAG: hypothetical protein HOP29_04260 [Phycisphaerales bacterium]|nr:hypothetical protein [Phycisphaerales bacterium]
MAHYRPWGLLDWVLPRCPVAGRWTLLGCLSTGERSLAVWRVLRNLNCLGSLKLLRIANKPSRHDAAVRRNEEDRLREFRQAGGSEGDIEGHNLLEPVSRIVEVIDAFLPSAGSNLVLDVTALPKRFFFPLLRLLIKRTSEVENLIVTYTSPARRTAEKLAENPDQWAHLPLFSGRPREKPDMMVISVGFEALGLQDHIHGEAGLPIKLLLPFPAPPEAYRRSLELARRLQRNRADVFTTYWTDAKEVGDAFDRIVSLTTTTGGRKRVILAPFGPKPISVAMCIFATLTESQVFYTQPSVYHPEYSRGVGQVGDLPAVWAYCLRLSGREYYHL